MKADTVIKEEIKEPTHRVITEENKHLFPPKTQEAFDYLMNTNSYSSTYYEGLKDCLLWYCQNLLSKKPDLPFKVVLFELFKDYPDDFEVDTMLNLINYLAELWKKHQIEPFKPLPEGLHLD